MAGNIKGLTIEIGGNTTKLTEALKKPADQTKALKSSLSDVNKALKFDPKNVDLLNQKQRVLTSTISSTEDELKLLKEAQAQYIASGKDIDGEEYISLEAKIATVEKSLQNLKKQQNNFSGEVQAMGIKLGEFGQKSEAVGKAMMPVSVAAAGLGTAAVKTAADFESSMSQVQATMGITKDSMSKLDGQSVNTMDALNALAQKMGRETAFSAKEAADAINYLALAGYDTQQMYDTLPTVLNLASAGAMDLASASDMVTDAMSALGMDTGQAENMVDQMAKTASSTNTSVSQLGEGILKIGGTAKTMAGGTAELNTALGILANNGIKGAEGGTHLRNVIMSLQSPTDTAADAMDQLGVKVFDANGKMRPMNDILGDLNKSMASMTDEQKQNLISKIFNTTDISSVNALLANTGDTWDDLQASITDSAGAAQQMADTQLDNLQGQLTLLKSALEGLAISIGDALMPIIKGCVGMIQSFVDWLNGLSDGTKTAIAMILAMVAAAGPLLITIGKMSTGMSSLIKYFGSVDTIGGKLIATFKNCGGVTGVLSKAMSALCSPIGLVVAIVGVLVGAFLTLWNTNEEFRTKITEIWNGITETLSRFFQGIVDRLNALGFSFSDISDVIQTIWQGLCDFLAPVFEGAFSLIANTLETCLNVITGLLDFFIGLFTGNWEQCWTGVKEIFGGIWDGLCGQFQIWMDTLQGIADVVLGWFGTDWNSVWQGISDFFSGIWNGIVAFFSDPIGAIQDMAQGLVSWFSETWISTWQSVQDFFTSCWQGIQDFFAPIGEFIMGIIQPVVDFFNGDWGSCWDNVKQVFEDAWNGITGFFTDTINNIKGGVSTFLGWFGISWGDENDKVASKTSETMSSVKDTSTKRTEETKSSVSSIWSGLQSDLSQTMDKLKSNLSSGWENVKSTASNLWSQTKSTAGTVWSGIKTSISDAADKAKNVAGNAWNGMKSVASNVWGNIKGSAQTLWNGVTSTISNSSSKAHSTAESAWNSMKRSATSIWNSMKSSAGTSFSGMGNSMSSQIRSATSTVTGSLTTMRNAFTSSMNSIRSLMSGGFNGVVSNINNSMSSVSRSVSQSMSNARVAAQNGINAIRSACNATIYGPRIILPHPYVRGSFSVNPPRVPTFGVSWYAKAMKVGAILRGATIFGQDAFGNLLGGGESGDEMIAGVNSVAQLIEESVMKAFMRATEPALAGAGSGSVEIDYDRLAEAIRGSVEIQNHVQVDVDGNRMARKLAEPMNIELERLAKRR